MPETAYAPRRAGRRGRARRASGGAAGRSCSGRSVGFSQPMIRRRDHVHRHALKRRDDEAAVLDGLRQLGAIGSRASRDQSPMYGPVESCACSPPRCWIACRRARGRRGRANAAARASRGSVRRGVRGRRRSSRTCHRRRTGRRRPGVSRAERSSTGTSKFVLRPRNAASAGDHVGLLLDRPRAQMRSADAARAFPIRRRKSISAASPAPAPMTVDAPLSASRSRFLARFVAADELEDHVVAPVDVGVGAERA